MTANTFQRYKSSLTLYELKKNLDFLIKLYDLEKLPKVLMLSGFKGIGKSTLISHFMNYVFDKQNYDLENNTICDSSSFYKQFSNNIFSNIIYLAADDFKNISIEDMRNLKSQLMKSTISNKKRFIILDDVELFNTNSLNTLLKIIEEPTINNYFVLINNKSKPLIETIYSRAIEMKIILTNIMQKNIIDFLVKNHNLEVLIDYENFYISPGNFLIFNNILKINKIDITDNYIKNLEKILSLYKKNKKINLINFSLFLTEYYFYNMIKSYDKNSFIEKKSFIIKNINNFVIYNLNQTSLINAINNKLFNE